VLEIGASIPARTDILAANCRELIGVELYPERVPADRGNIRYVVGDWQRLTDFVAGSSVDVAVSSHVIEHVPDDSRALDQLYEVLRPGGVAIVTTPNRKRLVRDAIESVRGERKFPWWEHVREYVETDLRALVMRSRFAKSEVYAVGLGVLGGPLQCYLTHVPKPMRRWANFWELHLWR
jgi:SAM-dependent methyltransferase